MNIGINKSSTNVLDKNVTWKYKDIDMKFKESTNVNNCTIILKNRENIKDCNYVYIPYLKKYYFIVEKRMLIGDIIELDLKVDVLMTYKSEIKKLSVYVTRNENKYNNYIQDDKVVVSSKRIRTTKNIGQVGGNYTYFITCNGISAN